MKNLLVNLHKLLLELADAQKMSQKDIAANLRVYDQDDPNDYSTRSESSVSNHLSGKIKAWTIPLIDAYGKVFDCNLFEILIYRAGCNAAAISATEPLPNENDLRKELRATARLQAEAADVKMQLTQVLEPHLTDIKAGLREEKVQLYEHLERSRDYYVQTILQVSHENMQLRTELAQVNKTKK